MAVRIYSYPYLRISNTTPLVAWTRKTPLFTDPGAILPNTSAKQGTVYWSPKWKVSNRLPQLTYQGIKCNVQSFVWIGGDGFPDANGLISTAPKAEGPWSAPIVSCRLYCMLLSIILRADAFHFPYSNSTAAPLVTGPSPRILSSRTQG
jgi:hypothetical protein